jgi:hypothetical protein
MKMPKFILRVAGRDFVIPDNRGLSALMTLMADAVPVDVDLHSNEITLDYTDAEEQWMVGALTRVSLTPIPRGVVWKRKRKTGEAEIVTPVAKPSKTLVATAKKALKLANGSHRPQLHNGSGPPRLTNGSHGPAPFNDASRKLAALRAIREQIGQGESQAQLL